MPLGDGPAYVENGDSAGDDGKPSNVITLGASEGYHADDQFSRLPEKLQVLFKIASTHYAKFPDIYAFTELYPSLESFLSRIFEQLKSEGDLDILTEELEENVYFGQFFSNFQIEMQEAITRAGGLPAVQAQLRLCTKDPSYYFKGIAGVVGSASGISLS